MIITLSLSLYSHPCDTTECANHRACSKIWSLYGSMFFRDLSWRIIIKTSQRPVWKLQHVKPCTENLYYCSLKLCNHVLHFVLSISWGDKPYQKWEICFRRNVMRSTIARAQIKMQEPENQPHESRYFGTELVCYSCHRRLSRAEQNRPFGLLYSWIDCATVELSRYKCITRLRIKRYLLPMNVNGSVKI